MTKLDYSLTVLAGSLAFWRAVELRAQRLGRVDQFASGAAYSACSALQLLLKHRPRAVQMQIGSEIRSSLQRHLPAGKVAA